MSCPNGGSAGIYGLLTRKRCLFQGKFDFVFTRASPRVGIIDILDRGGLNMADEVESGDLKKVRIFKLSMPKHVIRLCDH